MSKRISIVLLSLLFLLPIGALALNFDTGDELFSSETINDDYYAAGGTVTMESDVNGDVIVAGGQVTINSTVSQDLVVAGGELFVTGEIQDDARLAGGRVDFNATVKDDLIMAGGDVYLRENGFVGGDLIIAGGNVQVAGQVNGSLKGAGGSFYINNVITGDVVLHGVDKIRIGPKGKVLGNFTYKSPREAVESVNSETVLGTIKYEKSDVPISDKELRSFTQALLAGFSIFKLLTLLFTGLFLIWMLRFYLTNAVETSYHSPLKSFGLGLLILIGGPIVAILFLITGIGMSLSFIILLGWLLALAVAKSVAALVIGMKLIKITDKDSFLKTYASFALGAFILILISLVPLVGWILKFVIVMIALGAMMLYEGGLAESLRKSKKL